MIIKRSVYDFEGTNIHQLVQYDHDVYVYLYDNRIDKPCQIHFYSTKLDDKSIVVDSVFTKDGSLKIKIPNILLCDDCRIFGFCYVNIDDGERSIAYFEIDVMQKPKPEDWVEPEDDDFITISNAKYEILEYVNKYKNVVFGSYDEADWYAKNDSFAFIGQALTVLNENDDTVSVYVISNSKMDIAAVGSSKKVNDYESMINKPMINGVELSGNKSSADLKINVVALNNADIDYIFTI